MTSSVDTQQRERATALMNRLRVLLDFAEVQAGREVTFTDVASYLASRDIGISRARWSYMINAHRLVDGHLLLDALSDFFDVDPAYLRGDGQLPDSITGHLDRIRAVRVAKVRAYAARTLGDLSPETLEGVMRILDDEANRLQGAHA